MIQPTIAGQGAKVLFEAATSEGKRVGEEAEQQRMEQSGFPLPKSLPQAKSPPRSPPGPPAVPPPQQRQPPPAAQGTGPALGPSDA